MKIEEEEEEEEAVFIRGVSTNEDSPNSQHAQHAQHRPVQDTGARSAKPRYMPDLQLCCIVHPYHPVDTCQGAVNFPDGAVPSGAR